MSFRFPCPGISAILMRDYLPATRIFTSATTPLSCQFLATAMTSARSTSSGNVSQRAASWVSTPRPWSTVSAPSTVAPNRNLARFEHEARAVRHSAAKQAYRPLRSTRDAWHCRIVGPGTAWYRVAHEQTESVGGMDRPRHPVDSRLLREARRQNRSGGARPESDGSHGRVRRPHESSGGILSCAPPPSAETRVLVFDRFSYHRCCHRIHSLSGADSRAEYLSVLPLLAVTQPLPRHSRRFVRFEVWPYRVQRPAGRAGRLSKIFIELYGLSGSKAVSLQPNTTLARLIADAPIMTYAGAAAVPSPEMRCVEIIGEVMPMSATARLKPIETEV